MESTLTPISQTARASDVQHIAKGAKVNTPGLRWPTEDELRSNFELQGMNKKQIDEAVEKTLKDRKSVHESALDFERYFFTLMMAEMKKSKMKNKMFDGGRGEEIFDGMLNHEYAKQMVNDRTSLGLARMVEQELMRGLGGVSGSYEEMKKPLSANDTPDRVARMQFEQATGKSTQPASVEKTSSAVDPRALIAESLGEEEAQKIDKILAGKVEATQRAYRSQAASLAYANQEALR